MPADINAKIKFRNALIRVTAAIQNEFNIDPIIPISQWALESNWGLSELAIQGMNIASMTPGDAWLAFMRKEKEAKDIPTWSSLGIETVYYPTIEYSKASPEHIRYWEFPGDIVSKEPDGKGGSKCVVNRHFRKYVSWEESAWDWARKIAHDPRYRFAYDASKIGDMTVFSEAMSRAGYATNANYASALIAEYAAVKSLPAPDVVA